MRARRMSDLSIWKEKKPGTGIGPAPGKRKGPREMSVRGEIMGEARQ